MIGRFILYRAKGPKLIKKRVIMSCLLANMKGMYLTISAKLVTISVMSRLSLIPIQKKLSLAKKSLFRGYRYIHVSFYPGFTVVGESCGPRDVAMIGRGVVAKGVFKRGAQPFQLITVNKSLEIS
jgi:hypothetical protein